MIRIKPSNKIFEATKLPSVLNLNPRSIYNKIEEFKIFVEEHDIDLVCLSESWERNKDDENLNDILNIDDMKVISNPYQRQATGGRPAIIVKKSKFEVENLTNTSISIPWGVEIVWALLTPKPVNVTSKVQKIVVASIYCKPDSRKKTELLDHIAQVYGHLSSKYQKGLHWILSGDTNDLKLDSILMLNSKMCQVVQSPTRLNPPRILDPIITTLSDFYQMPDCLPPLEADQNKGVASDHLMVVMKPLLQYSSNYIRSYKKIRYRPLSDVGLQKMRDWLEHEEWTEVSLIESADDKAKILHQKLIAKYYEFFPEKECKIASDSKPFFNSKLQKLRRIKRREYAKHRKSAKWLKVKVRYDEELKNAKRSFYTNKIAKLKKANPRKWYSELKKLTSFDQHESEDIVVDDIKDFSVEKQAELIADKFAEVSNEYDKLKTDDINIPEFETRDIHQFNEDEVLSVLKGINTQKTNVVGDVPAFVYKQFADLLVRPVTNVINASIRQGTWPSICKMEIVTPVPKEHPTKSIDQLRNISGLTNLNKVFEKLIIRLVVDDMKAKIDPSQYANQKGLSIQHYLVKFIDRILSALDKGNNSKTCAVLATLVDWKQAFPRQCPKLGIESFIQNGVRPSLIPLIMSFFQNRKMRV